MGLLLERVRRIFPDSAHSTEFHETTELSKSELIPLRTAAGEQDGSEVCNPFARGKLKRQPFRPYTTLGRKSAFRIRTQNFPRHRLAESDAVRLRSVPHGSINRWEPHAAPPPIWTRDAALSSHDIF
jgi:hypothetical protein